MFFLNHFTATFGTAAATNIVTALYLLWKLKTGGFFDAIAEDKSNYNNGLAGVIGMFMLLCAYAGISVVFGLAAFALYGVSGLALVTTGIAAFTHSLSGQGVQCFAVLAATLPTVIYACKTSFLRDKRSRKTK